VHTPIWPDFRLFVLRVKVNRKKHKNYGRPTHFIEHGSLTKTPLGPSKHVTVFRKACRLFCCTIKYFFFAKERKHLHILLGHSITRRIGTQQEIFNKLFKFSQHIFKWFPCLSVPQKHQDVFLHYSLLSSCTNIWIKGLQLDIK